MNATIVSKVQELCSQGSREQILQVFRDYPEHFSCIPLPDSEVDPDQAINDILREKVMLNGVEFYGNGNLFLESLRQVVEILTISPGYAGTRTASEIVERILCKASRTTSGSDSYFTVQQLFGASDYLLKSRGGDEGKLPPIHIEVFLVDSSIHSVVSCVNYYGLYSLGAIEAASKSFRVRKPTSWLRLDTVVVEKTDYRTCRNVRYLRIDTPDRPDPPSGSPPAPPPEELRAGLGMERLINLRAGLPIVREEPSSPLFALRTPPFGFGLG